MPGSRNAGDSKILDRMGGRIKFFFTIYIYICVQGCVFVYVCVGCVLSIVPLPPFFLPSPIHVSYFHLCWKRSVATLLFLRHSMALLSNRVEASKEFSYALSSASPSARPNHLSIYLSIYLSTQAGPRMEVFKKTDIHIHTHTHGLRMAGSMRYNDVCYELVRSSGGRS